MRFVEQFTKQGSPFQQKNDSTIHFQIHVSLSREVHYHSLILKRPQNIVSSKLHSLCLSQTTRQRCRML